MVEFCYSRLEDGKDVFGLKLENVGPTFSSYEYMNVIYVNCGVKNYVKEDHRSYLRNFCSYEKKAWKTKIQACTGFEPLTSGIQVQRPTN